MFCNKCGNNLGDAEGVRFCNKCGNDLSVSAVKVEKVIEEPKAQVIDTIVEEPKVDLEKRKSNKKKLWITAIVCCVLWVGLIIGGIVLLVGFFGNMIDNYEPDYDYEYEYDDEEQNEDEDFTWGLDEEEPVEDEEEDIPVVEGTRVGSDEQGYVTVPDSWEEKDTGYDGMIQYLNAREGSITLYSVSTSLLSAEGYADNLETTMPSQGINKVNREEVKLGKYDAYKLWGYSETLKIWLTVWTFEAEDGQTHYLAIETLAEDSEPLEIADTFSLEK